MHALSRFKRSSFVSTGIAIIVEANTKTKLQTYRIKKDFIVNNEGLGSARCKGMT